MLEFIHGGKGGLLGFRYVSCTADNQTMDKLISGLKSGKYLVWQDNERISKFRKAGDVAAYLAVLGLQAKMYSHHLELSLHSSLHHPPPPPTPS